MLLTNAQSSYEYAYSVPSYYVIKNKSTIKTCTPLYKHDSHDLGSWTPFPGYCKTLCILSPTVHTQITPGPGWQPASLFWRHPNQPESIVICRSSLKTRCPPFHRLAYCIVFLRMVYCLQSTKEMKIENILAIFCNIFFKLYRENRIKYSKLSMEYHRCPLSIEELMNNLSLSFVFSFFLAVCLTVSLPVFMSVCQAIRSIYLNS